VTLQHDNNNKYIKVLLLTVHSLYSVLIMYMFIWFKNMDILQQQNVCNVINSIKVSYVHIH